MTDPHDVVDDRIECAECGDLVPRSHATTQVGVGRLCCFCYSEDYENGDADYEDDYYDYDSAIAVVEP